MARAAPSAAGRMTSRVRVERPLGPADGRDVSGQPLGEWVPAAECWAAVASAPPADSPAERYGGTVAASGRRVTVYRDAVPGVEEAGTRWRVVLLVLHGRQFSPPPVWHVVEVGVPEGLTVALDCRGDQRSPD